MSTEDPGSSRQGDFGVQVNPGFDLSGEMSTLLGNAGAQVSEALRHADEATRTIFEQATREAREHHVQELEKAQRMTRERIEKLTSITAEVNAQGQTLERHAQELADVMRRSTDGLPDELGLDSEPAMAPETSSAEESPPQKALEPETMAGYGESPEASTKPPMALRELFGFKRKRDSEGPPVNEVNAARAQMLIAGYASKIDR
jgi:hypothetical protein